MFRNALTLFNNNGSIILIFFGTNRYRIMTTYIDPNMTVMMTVTEMYASVMVVHQSLQNMMMTMTVCVIKKMPRHNDLTFIINDASP